MVIIHLETSDYLHVEKKTNEEVYENNRMKKKHCHHNEFNSTNIIEKFPIFFTITFSSTFIE